MVRVEERGDDGGDLGRTVEQQQVTAALDDLEARVGQAARDEPGVDERDDRVVIPMDDESRLASRGAATGRLLHPVVPASR